MNTAQFADRHFDRPVRPRLPARRPNDPRPRSGRSPNPAGTRPAPPIPPPDGPGRGCGHPRPRQSRTNVPARPTGRTAPIIRDERVAAASTPQTIGRYRTGRPASSRTPNPSAAHAAERHTPAGSGDSRPAPWWWCSTVLTHRIIGSAGERGMNIEHEGEHHHIPCHDVPHARHGRHTPVSDSSGTSAGPVPSAGRRPTMASPSSYGQSRLLARLPWLSPAGVENQTPDPVRRRAAIRPAQGSSVRLPRPVSALPGTVFGVRDHAPGDRVLRGNVSPCPATTRERHHHRRRRRFQSPHDVCALAQCSPLHLQLIAELIAGIHASAIRRPPRCHPHSIFVTEGRAARDR